MFVLEMKFWDRYAFILLVWCDPKSLIGGMDGMEGLLYSVVDFVYIGVFVSPY